MQEAIDTITAALDGYSCLAVQRHADRSVLLTVTDKSRSVAITKVIPFASLRCKPTVSSVIKDLKRDLDDAAGMMSSDCLTDLRTRGPRLMRFET